MELLKCAAFKEAMNGMFKVKFGDPIPELEGLNHVPEPLELELVEAEERDNEQFECFSLIFHGPAGRLLPQKTYTLVHDTLGEQQIFLVPVGEKAEGEGENRKVVGYQYQAIFTRFKQQRQ